jgi:hypothetical protein
MAFEELIKNTEDIEVHSKAFIESSMAYYKLWGFKVAMKSTNTILKFTLIFISLGMVLLFCSIAGAFALGDYYGSNAIGFLIVGGLYLALTFFLFIIKDKIVEGPILEKFSTIFFND